MTTFTCTDCQASTEAPMTEANADDTLTFPHTEADSHRLYPRECDGYMVAGA